MIKVIAVDFGGVYFKWDYSNYLNKLSKISGQSKEKIVNILSKKIKDFHVKKISEEEYWDYFCKQINKKINHNILKKLTLESFKENKSVITLTKKLRKNYKIALVANQTVGLDELDKKYNFYKNFDLLLSSHLIKMQKPNKNIFQLLLKLSSVRSDEILFIDDTKLNIIAAEKMGINSILFKDVKDLKKRLNLLGVLK